MSIDKYMDKEEIPEGWLSTSEIANALKVSNAVILNFKSQHPEQFIGQVTSNMTLEGTKHRRRNYWSPQAQKILGLGIQNEPVDEWRQQNLAELEKGGAVIPADASPQQMLRIVGQQLINYANTVDMLNERMERLELRDRFTYIIPKTKKKLRNYNAYIRQKYEIDWWKIWKSIRNKYEVNGYDDLTEEQGQEILRYYKEKYP